MKLLTSALEKAFAQQGSQENISDPIVIAKYFDPCSSWTWYATEFNPESKMFFGFVIGFEGEWGYFSLDELGKLRNKLGQPIERDLYFDSKPFSKVKEIPAHFRVSD